MITILFPFYLLDLNAMQDSEMSGELFLKMLLNFIQNYKTWAYGFYCTLFVQCLLKVLFPPISPLRLEKQATKDEEGWS